MACDAPPSRQAVDTLVAALAHPHDDAIQHLRQIIRDLDPRIVETIKWNAPSFRTTEHFATLQPRFRDGVQLILHFGAIKRDVTGLSIADPDRLLEWRSADRASVKFGSLDDLVARRDALEGVLRQWLEQLPKH